MELATIAHNYLDRFKARYGQTIDSNQWSALNAWLGCRTAQYGQVHLSCSRCPALSMRYQSCGHRSCNQCQNHNTTQWLARQQKKLLPIEYFMVTFTLPYELRALTKRNPKLVYALLFECAVATLMSFGLNDQALAAELATTIVLHTHSRDLNYHPHVHMIVPGGGVTKKRREWVTVKGEYLFNGNLLASVFRGKLLSALQDAGLNFPPTPEKWVAQCKHVGKGLPALKYLSRYLYRGVISDKHIISDDGTTVTFEYIESKTGKRKMRRLAGEEFINLLLQHILPKGFRRVRDYGWLHGNAKKLLRLVQWVLQVRLPTPHETPRPCFVCTSCGAPMAVVGFSRPRLKPG